MTKRRIDVIRDAAIELKLEGNNAGAIQDLYSLGSRMLSIHSRGIFELQLPDQIDPGRTNPAIKPTYQQVLGVGSDSPDVVRTILQARRLFRVGFIPPPLDLVRAQEIVFDGLQDLLAMRDIADTATSQVTGLIESFNAAKVKRGLPSLPNLKPQCEMFMQKAKHVTASMRDLAQQFFPDAAAKKDWPAAVVAAAGPASEKGTENASDAWASWAEFLAFVADARNAMEHRDQDKRFIVRPFLLTHENVIVPPVIEVVHPRRPHPPMLAHQFLNEVTDLLRDSYETLIIGLAAAHAVSFSGLKTAVYFVPEEERGSRPERYAYYGLKPDGEWAMYL